MEEGRKIFFRHILRSGFIQAVRNNTSRGVEEYADNTTERGKCLLKTICDKFGFDSLGYQSLDGVLEAIGIDKDKVCTYCWTGKE